MSDTNIIWFKRGDGVLFCADFGSPSFQLMSKDGSFAECDIEGQEVNSGVLIESTNLTENITLPLTNENQNDEKLHDVAMQYQILTDSEKLLSQNEISSEIDKSTLENSGAPSDSGQGSPAKRGRSGKRNKANDS